MSAKIILFDAYGTLFDVYTVKEKCEEFYEGKGESISRLWREKQLEYCFLSQLTQKYEPFDQLTRKGLQAALDQMGENYDTERIDTLFKAYEQLQPFEETETVLKQLSGRKTAIFSNGTKGMLDPLIRHNGFEELIGSISADGIRQYKPAPAAYSYAMEKLGAAKEDILFVSCNQWDIAGAASFGFKTVWINRKEEPLSRLGFKPHKQLNSLEGLAEIG
ncbi:haloacid dehalogenase type II [Bacillus mangrovi]|uniref:Haloacid dehalogenase type II n=1 Tax=Metabacillus mangrovi TaxID=1491830 RepID=A0A7X2S4W3_9BACI|nr:haloacid dehalogenase type II [Metabacillus mangrovi]MTH53763.1 haloacid dehalogenase type II [Metabacillus mangrovi]